MGFPFLIVFKLDSLEKEMSDPDSKETETPTENVEPEIPAPSDSATPAADAETPAADTETPVVADKEEVKVASVEIHEPKENTDPALENETGPPSELKEEETAPVAPVVVDESEPVKAGEEKEVPEEDKKEVTEEPVVDGEENKDKADSQEDGEAEDQEPEEEDPAAYMKEQARRRKPVEIKEIADDFYYDYEEKVFKPLISEESKQSPDLVKLL